ncbi:heparinase II/III family protein [Magnetospira sp. QH-2]|uniref:heparinase II/III family protein n=1 Tax=Magnetospira sp. (strain QH-2) TaxID=1288970 RepID=UPI0003E80C96|nr:heparinase II/III family protein [Magnetospira sp. QH-2]CCQ75527.1 putative Heparinase II/III-like domain [Magnetospira sp. QH-2]
MPPSDQDTPSQAPRLRDRLYQSFLYQWTLGTRVPNTLEQLPPDPWLGDPARGQAILNGALPLLGGDAVTLTPGPWPTGGGDRSAALACHQFGWLRDLRAVGTGQARETARGLIEIWVTHHGRYDSFAWRPEVVGERLANWLMSYEYLVSGASAEFPGLLMACIGRQVRHLRRVAPRAAVGRGAFSAAKGLILTGLSLPKKRSFETGLTLLEEQAERQILADGGHLERSPEALFEVLKALVEIRSVLVAFQSEVPSALQRAIDRAAPAVRGYLLGDGTLARFNGGTEGDADEIAALLAQADVRGRPLAHAPHSGFHRLYAGRTCVIMDAGPPPPPGNDHTAHAGTLSFEMSAGKHRLVVNCGAHPHPENAWNRALRATAAHSTLVVEDTNSSELIAAGGLGRRRPDTVPSRHHQQDRCILVEASHDGYEPIFELNHHRMLYLSGDGDDMRGEDLLEGPGGERFALRFHLHPRVQVSLVEGGQAALLKVPRGAGWRFLADGGPVSLEGSLYMDRRGETHNSHQIVVAGALDGNGLRVKWRLHKIGGK